MGIRQSWEQDPDAWKGKSETPEMVAALFARRIRECNVSIDRLNTALQRFGDAVALWELMYGPIEEEGERDH